MEVALTLFARQGFYNTSISQIAKAAKVSKGLLYNYFASKDQLLEELVMQELDQSEGLFQVLEEATLEPVAQLKMLLDGAFEMVQSDVTHWKLIAMLSLQEGILERLSHLLRKKTERGYVLATRIFERMGVPDPMGEAYLLGATLDGIFLHYLTTRELNMAYPLEDLKNRLINRYSNYTSSDQKVKYD